MVGGGKQRGKQDNAMQLGGNGVDMRHGTHGTWTWAWGHGHGHAMDMDMDVDMDMDMWNMDMVHGHMDTWTWDMAGWCTMCIPTPV